MRDEHLGHTSSGETKRSIRRLWGITYPLIVSNFAQVLITVVDTLLLARFSTSALAAVALAAPLYLVATMVVRAWATAVQIVVARRFGAGRHDSVGGVTATGLAAATLTGLVFAAVLGSLAPIFLQLLGGNPTLIALGSDYLRIMAIAVPFAAATFVLQGAYAGLGATRVAMAMMMLVNVVNLTLGVVLIFGLGLGVIGAALAGLLSTITGSAFMLGYGRWRHHQPAVLRRSGLRAWRTNIATLGRLASPEAVFLFLGYFNEVLIFGFVAQLGGPELGAYRLLDNLTLIIYTLVASAGTGVSIAVGQRLGASQLNGARIDQRAGLILAVALAAVPAVPALVLPASIYPLATPDRAVVDLAVGATVVAVVGLIPALLALNVIGVLRAAGDNKTVMWASVIADYAVLVPLAWLLGIYVGWGLNGIFLAWLGYYSTLLAVAYRKLRTGAWRTSRI